jgi:hypothetical protein
MGEREHIIVLEGHLAVIDELATRLRTAVDADDYMELTDVLNELEEELERAGDNIKKQREALR